MTDTELTALAQRFQGLLDDWNSLTYSPMRRTDFEQVLALVEDYKHLQWYSEDQDQQIEADHQRLLEMAKRGKRD